MSKATKFDVDRAPIRREAVPVKDWTSLDHLTHDFANCAGYREYCLRECGQYMGHDGKRVVA